MPKRNEVRIALGKAIAFHRIKAGLSQAELAKMVGVTPASLSQCEAGCYAPRLDILFGLAKGLDFSLDQFITYAKVKEIGTVRREKLNKLLTFEELAR